MSKTLDIYTRVSEVGDREGESFQSPADQEATARRWLEREGIDAGELVYEEDVSGGLRPDDRELGRLIERVESGESGGIIIPWLDRLTRDVGHGGLILDRIVKAGGRLVTSDDVFDSAKLTPEMRLVYNQLLSVGQYIREKNRAARLNGSRNAAARGVYLGSRAPFGYLRREQVEPQYRTDGTTLLRDGVLVVDPVKGPLVPAIFERRADGWTARAIRDWLRDEHSVEVTVEGLRKVFLNRAYVGEAHVPTVVKGQPEIKKNAHPALVTEDLWERANTVGDNSRFRTTGRLSSQVRLAGLVYCASCGRKLKTAGARDGRPQYACTAEGCPARSVIRAERLDAYVEDVLGSAFLHREPHIVAIMEGDDRYARALERVEEARVELDTYRAEIRVSDVGAEQWKRDVAIRQAKLDLARKELRSIPAPKTADPYAVPTRPGQSFEEWLPGHMRAHHARFIARVVVKPVGRGRRVRAGERAEVWFVGAEEPIAGYGTFKDGAWREWTAEEYALSEQITEAVAAWNYDASVDFTVVGDDLDTEFVDRAVEAACEGR